MGIFSPDVWTHCNYIAETFGDMFLTHCDTSVPTFTILVRASGRTLDGSRPVGRVSYASHLLATPSRRGGQLWQQRR